MANPVLTPKRIQDASDEFEPGWAMPTSTATGATRTETSTAEPTRTGATMTAGGTFAKTFLLWAIVVAAAAYSWSKTKIPAFGQIHLPGWTWPALFVGFGLAMLTIFKPKFAPFTSPLYAIAEGLFLGGTQYYQSKRVFENHWNVQ